MKRAAISTLGEQFLLSNYGTFFQHYALRRILREMGLEPFRVSHVSDRYERAGFLWNWCKDVIRPFYWLLMMRPNWLVKCRQMFEADIQNMIFLGDYRKLIGRFHETQDFENAAVGIMGGDQILGTQSERDWLNDIPVGGMCITYAASSDWRERRNDDQWQKFASRQFKRFVEIGIRELAGVALCRDLVGKPDKVRHVADPVMLLKGQDYARIASARTILKSPTLFCYVVNVRSEEDLRIDEYVRLAGLLGCELKIAGIQGAELVIPYRYRIRLSPMQFVRAMIDAKYFITNSYHGSVFATILKKNFLSICQNCLPGTDQNERQKEFMMNFGLQSRWMDWRVNVEKWYSVLMEPVDWNAVHCALDDFRSESLVWLKGAVGA